MLNVNNGIGLFRRIVKSLAGGVSEHERLGRALHTEQACSRNNHIPGQANVIIYCSGACFNAMGWGLR